MTVDIDELQRLSEAATPGPWKRQSGEYTGEDWLIASLGLDTPSNEDQFLTTHNLRSSELDGEGAAADAAFIAAARNQLPELLARMRKLEKAVASAKDVLTMQTIVNAAEPPDRKHELALRVAWDDFDAALKELDE